MERQTDLTLAEIVRRLRTENGSLSGCPGCHKGGASYPPCLLANEVGVMANQGNVIAEAFLCELLICDNSVPMRAISYAYLKNLPSKQLGTEEAVRVFLADPKSAEVLLMVEEREEEGREELQRMADMADKHLPGNS